jgi:hypothetical protein
VDSGCELQWRFCGATTSGNAMEGIAGHSMVPWLVQGQQCGALLVIGGFASDGAARRQCYTMDPATGEASPFPALDTPRCFHGTACFSDGCIVVIGGLSAASAADQPLATASMYDPDKGHWRPMKMSCVVPGMVHPCVSGVGVEMLVFAGSGKAGELPQLFSMIVVGDTLMVKTLACLGETPVSQYGLSSVIDESTRTLYVLGANAGDKSAPHLHRLLLPLS